MTGAALRGGLFLAPTAGPCLLLHATAVAGVVGEDGCQILRLLNFGDRLDPALFGSGNGDLVAGMQLVQRQAVLCLELIDNAAAVCAGGPALRMLNRNRAIDPVNLGNR